MTTQPPAAPESNESPLDKFEEAIGTALESGVDPRTLRETLERVLVSRDGAADPEGISSSEGKTTESQEAVKRDLLAYIAAHKTEVASKHSLSEFEEVQFPIGTAYFVGDDLISHMEAGNYRTGTFSFIGSDGVLYAVPFDFDGPSMKFGGKNIVCSGDLLSAVFETGIFKVLYDVKHHGPSPAPAPTGESKAIEVIRGLTREHNEAVVVEVKRKAEESRVESLAAAGL